MVHFLNLLRIPDPHFGCHCPTTFDILFEHPPLFSFLKVKNPPLEPSSLLSLPPKQPNKIGFDEVHTLSCMHTWKRTLLPAARVRGVFSFVCTQVFMINLVRRSDRRERMLRSLYEQELSCKVVAAVDGKYVSHPPLLPLHVST